MLKSWGWGSFPPFQLGEGAEAPCQSPLLRSPFSENPFPLENPLPDTWEGPKWAQPDFDRFCWLRARLCANLTLSRCTHFHWTLLCPVDLLRTLLRRQNPFLEIPLSQNHSEKPVLSYDPFGIYPSEAKDKCSFNPLRSHLRHCSRCGVASTPCSDSPSP